MKKFTLAMGTVLLCSLLFTSFIIISRIFQSKHEVKKAENEKDELQFIEEAWKQDFERTKSPITGHIPRGQLLAAKEYVAQRLSQMNANNRAVPGVTWTERGPVNVGG